MNQFTMNDNNTIFIAFTRAERLLIPTRNVRVMAGIYTTLTLKNHEEFEMYKNALDTQGVRVCLDNRNMALRMKDYKLIAVIKTEFPLPTGILIAKNRSGKKIEIQVSSGRKVIVDEHINILGQFSKNARLENVSES